jgi:hypothetical protein
MNTLSINTSSRPLVWRFAWKEYRMLRGFWIACAVIAILLQSLPKLLFSLYHNLGNPIEYVTIAWSAAALYTVGATIMMFAAETEDRTRDYLRLLPGNWIPIFATKVAMALASAVLLAGFLTLTGWLFRGAIPSQQDTLFVLKVAGVGVLEFLAWGLLFSLWWKHPLMAAVAAIAAASFGAQGAILATSNANNSWTTEAYVRAVPVRLAICLVVFAVDVWLGRRWLYPVGNAKTASGRDANSTSGLLVANSARVTERPRRRMFGRLLWQTWREAWKPILVAVPLAFALPVAMVGVLEQFAHLREFSFMYLILPALLGALAFRADWQKDHRLFLATHATRPRYVWLARQVVWWGVVVVLGMVATLIATYLFQALNGNELLRTVRGYERYGNFFSLSSIASAMERGRKLLGNGILTAWCAVFSAYAVGQLCSMLLKQTVLAGFAAILLSVVLAAWSVLMFVWQMNPFGFVLPIGLGTLLATWLRVPSWILGQNQWKHWVGTAMVVALPLVLAVAYVPSTRMAQIENIELPAYHYLREPLEVSIQEFKERQKRLQESLLKLEQLGIAEEPWIEDIVLDGKKLVDYELNERALEFYGPGRYVGYYDEHVNELDPAEVEILDRFQAEATRQGLEANRAKIPELLAIVYSPDFQPIYGVRYLLEDRYNTERLLGEFTSLLVNDAKMLRATGDLDEAWQSLRAIPLIDPQFLYSERRFNFYKEVIAWAEHPDQTSERLKQAIVDLQQVFTRLPSPRDIILNNRNCVREVILGERAPRYANFNRFYFFLNQLPGEQARALRALDLLTTQALNQIDAVTVLVDQDQQLGIVPAENVSELLRLFELGNTSEVYDGHSKERSQELRQAFSTSFLAESEFDYVDPAWIASNWVAEETRRRGLLVQLALIAYKLDHGEYPKTLAELTPGWLAEPIDDPFSGYPFVYRPEGLPHKLLSLQGDEVAFIAPDTPLIWSVGYDNMQLMEARPMEFIVKQYGGWQAVDEKFLAAAEAGEQYNYFRGTYRRGGNPFVFPLPKVEKSQDSETEAP